MEGDGIRFNFLGNLPFGFLLLWLHDVSYGCNLWIGSSFRFMELGAILFLDFGARNWCSLGVLFR